MKPSVLALALNVDNTSVRGGSRLGVSNVQQIIDDGGTFEAFTGDFDGRTGFKNDYQTYNLLFGWDYSTLDRPVFPTKGMSHTVDATIGLGDTNYQKLVYQGNVYYPFYKDWVARGYTRAWLW